MCVSSPCPSFLLPLTFSSSFLPLPPPFPQALLCSHTQSWGILGEGFECSIGEAQMELMAGAVLGVLCMWKGRRPGCAPCFLLTEIAASQKMLHPESDISRLLKRSHLKFPDPSHSPPGVSDDFSCQWLPCVLSGEAFRSGLGR